MQDIAPLEQLTTYLQDKEYYSNNSLSTFLACRRLGYYTKELGLASPRPQPAADFGTSLHEGLAGLYKTYDATTMLERFRAAWDAYLGWLPQDKLEKRLARANGEDILLDYTRYWRNDPIIVEPSMVEVGTVIEMTPPKAEPFLYVSRMDLVCKQVGSQLLGPADHKSCKSLTDKYFQQFTPDRQMTGYIYTLNKLLGAQASRSVLVNAILVSHTQRQFARQNIIRIPADLAEWEVETCQIVADIRRAREEGTWYQNTKQCNSYGECAFRECCTTHMNPSVMHNFPTRTKTDPLHLGS